MLKKGCGCNKSTNVTPELPKDWGIPKIDLNPIKPDCNQLRKPWDCPDILPAVLINNNPDNEDITSVIEGNLEVLKFADKAYNPMIYSGMGRVFLRKNLIDDDTTLSCPSKVNKLELWMFNDKDGQPLTNTIFIVQYDYDLKGGFITIPCNSILLFLGGSFNNGTVILTDTLVLPHMLEYSKYMNCAIKGSFAKGLTFYSDGVIKVWNGVSWVEFAGSTEFTLLLNELKEELNIKINKNTKDILFISDSLNNYALKVHLHVLSDITGLLEALNNKINNSDNLITINGTTLKKGDSITIKGGGDTPLGGVSLNDVLTEIRKLNLNHTSSKIQLKYDNDLLNEVNDNTGNGGGGDTPQGGVSLADVQTEIGKLSLHHPGNQIQLKYGDTPIGGLVNDNTGSGGGGGDSSDDGLPGNILTYFIATTSSTAPNTPPDGLLPPEGSDWSINCPDREEGKYIWMSQIYETYSKHYGNWSEPILLSDGSLSSGSDTSDREYIYARADMEDWERAGIPNPNNNPERWPSESGPWYDNPQGVTQELRFEFISFKYKTSEDRWSDWQGPYVWSSYGRNGTDGDGVEYIFFAGNSTPTGNDDPFTWYTDAESKRGDKDGDNVAYNSDEYIPRGSQWKDDPQELIPGQTQWVSTRKYRNDVDPQSSEQGDSYWHQYSRPTIWNHYAQDITSAGALDFDNQTMGIPVDTEGNNLAFIDTSDAYIYYGIGDIPIQLLTCNGLFDGDNTIWTLQDADSYVRITNNHVTVDILAGTLRNIIGKTYTLRFTATAADVEPRTGVIKLVGLTTGSDGCSYKLKVNTRVIKSGVGTSLGQNVPDRIVPQMLKTKGTVPKTEYSVKNLPDGFKIEYLKDNDTSTQQLKTDEISTLNITDKVLLQLKYNDFIIDEELIFVIQDGVEGIPGTVYNIVPLPSKVSWDPETNKTTGTLTFEAYRKIGANDEEYLSGGKFGTSTDTGSIEVKLDNHTITATESQHIYTANINNDGQYSVIQINLLVSSPSTKVASIVIPIIQKGASGSQTLLLGIMRYREVDCSDVSGGVTFYDGKNPDPDAQNGYFQDFVIWNGANSKDWGTYLCVNKVNLPPATIPYTGVSLRYFTKMNHTFAEIVDYLIAHRAWIDELSVRQVVVFDNETPKPNIVAGMTSGNTLPTELTEKHISNDLGIRIWAGKLTSSDLNSAPFTVDSSGHVKATDAEIVGSVQANEFQTGKDNEPGIVVLNDPTITEENYFGEGGSADTKKAYMYHTEKSMNLAIFVDGQWKNLDLINALLPIAQLPEFRTTYYKFTKDETTRGFKQERITLSFKDNSYYCNNSPVADGTIMYKWITPISFGIVSTITVNKNLLPFYLDIYQKCTFKNGGITPSENFTIIGDHLNINEADGNFISENSNSTDRIYCRTNRYVSYLIQDSPTTYTNEFKYLTLRSLYEPNSTPLRGASVSEIEYSAKPIENLGLSYTAITLLPDSDAELIECGNSITITLIPSLLSGITFEKKTFSLGGTGGISLAPVDAADIRYPSNWTGKIYTNEDLRVASPKPIAP